MPPEIAAAACCTALTMFTYPVQRHRLPEMAQRISSSLGLGFFSRNALLVISMQTALAEVFTMGVKAGVEPIALWKAVRQGAGGRRRTFDGLADQFLPGKFDPPAFALRLAHKDVTLATALGREHKVPMKLANITLEEMTEALNRGWADRDSRVAMLLQEERAGVQIKVTEEAIREALAIDKTPPR